MTGLFIKKAFFDGWDNLLSLIVFNLGVILIIAFAVYFPMLFGGAWQASLIAAMLGVVLLSIYNGGIARLGYSMACYKRPDFRELFPAIKQSLPQSLFFGIINAVHLLLLSIVVPFYFSMGGVLGLAALSLIFWISIAWWLASQWFFPLLIQLPGRMKVLVKKCFIIFFDNPGFSLFMAIHGFISLLFSMVTALLMPGTSSILTARQGALKLLMNKYDYLEEHEDADRKHIPWASLLVEEKEMIGHRSLKGMIFPWKE